MTATGAATAATQTDGGTAMSPAAEPSASGRRTQRAGLLSRPPSTFRELGAAWAALIIDPAAQIRALASLRDEGLISLDEFERAKDRALRWSPTT